MLWLQVNINIRVDSCGNILMDFELPTIKRSVQVWLNHLSTSEFRVGGGDW